MGLYSDALNGAPVTIGENIRLCQNLRNCETRRDLIRIPCSIQLSLRAHLMVNPDLTATVIRDGTLRNSRGKSRLRVAQIAEGQDGAVRLFLPSVLRP